MMTPRQERRAVREVMTEKPTTVRPSLPVRDLAQLFEERGVNAFPVVDNDGQLLGIVTKLDVLRVYRPGLLQMGRDVHAPEAETVGDILRPGVVTLEADDPLVAAIDLMLETRLSSLPVVSRAKGKDPALVGMVSRGDLLRALQ